MSGGGRAATAPASVQDHGFSARTSDAGQRGTRLAFPTVAASREEAGNVAPGTSAASGRAGPGRIRSRLADHGPVLGAQPAQSRSLGLRPRDVRTRPAKPQ